MSLRSFFQIFYHPVKRVWEFLTEPFEALALSDRRLSIITSVLLLISTVAVWLEQMNGQATPPAALFILILSYFLARTRLYKVAMFVLVLTLTVPSYLVAFTVPDPTPGRINNAFIWVVLPLLLSSLVYSARTTIIISALNIIIVASLPFIRAELTYEIIGSTLGFLSMVAVFIITVMTQRNQLEKDRQKELIKSRNQLREEVSQRENFARQAQRRADLLVMLNEVSREISNIQSLDNVLDVVFEQIKRAISLDVFFVALHDEKTDSVSFPIMFDNGRKWQEKTTSLEKANRIARVIRSGEPLLINRTPDEIKESTENDTRLGDRSRTSASTLMSPLYIGSRVTGVISAQSYSPDTYSNDHLSILTALAHHIVIAIENARLFEQTTKRTQRLGILNEIGREISTLTSLSALMENVYRQVHNALSADFFFIGLYDRDKNELSFPLMYDDGKRWKQQANPVTDDTFSGKTILTRKPLLINEWSDAIKEGEAPPIIVGDNEKITKSLMFAPMVFGKETIGVISAQSYKTNVYNEEDLGLLSGIAYQVTIAIQNTRLLEETKQNAQHLSILNELGREVTELRNLPDLLDIVYKQIKQNLIIDAFFVGFHHPESDTISYPIMYDEEIKYDLEPDKIGPNNYLTQFLQGEGAKLILRTPEEIEALANDDRGTLGNPTRRSASMIIAPLKAGSQIIGIISIQSYGFDAYTEDDLHLLLGIGNQIGIAIQNARLLEEIKQNAEHLSILNEVGKSVSKIMELPDLLEAVYEQGKKSISLDAFYVGLYNAETHELSFPIMYDNGKRFEQPSKQLSQSSFLNSFLNGEQSLLINRSEEEIEKDESNLNALGQTDKMSASIIAVPLISRNDVIGMISAQSYSFNAYDEKDVILLKGIANQVAIAIENSRLFTAAQQEIKERQKVEGQLRSAEARYRELVERVPAVIYSADIGAEGHWHYVSPQIETLLGYSTNEWLTQPSLWLERVHPEDREYVRVAERQAIEESERVEMEYRMTTKDGQVIWIHDESLNISSSDPDQPIMQGFLMDITARKQAELTLKASEEKYHTLFLTAERQALELSLISSVQEALTRELDLNTLLKRVVDEIARSFGYTFVSAYLLEHIELKLVHQVGYDPNHAIYSIPSNKGISGKVIRTGQAVLVKDVEQEPDFLRADQAIQAEICVPLFDGDKICGILNIESAPTYDLDESDLRLMQTIAEQVNIAIRRARLYTERAESLKREQYINEFAHAISGTLDLPEILEKVARVSVSLTSAETATISLISEDGNKMTDVFSVNENIQASEVIPKGRGLTWQVYDRGQPIIVDDYPNHPDAIKEWVDSGLHAFMGIPISAGENKLGILAVYNRTPGKTFTQRDLSLVEAMARETAIAIQNARLFDALQLELAEHKLTQEQLISSVDELENKNAELEKFTYTVSHDLKSPIVTISGFLGFLEADLQKGNYEKIPNTIGRIRDAAKKMEQLLNELLELSRIGRLVNPPKEVQFGELVRETLELVDGQLRENQIEVKVESDFPIVNVDRIRIVEVLQNLITNAAKFMGDQKNPTVNIGVKIIDEEKVFFVKDNGIGIAPEFHDRIFGLFNKLDQFSDGTGIGLALVKRIIEVHGGRIWVESESGNGTTFFFTLENIKQEEIV